MSDAVGPTNNHDTEMVNGDSAQHAADETLDAQGDETTHANPSSPSAQPPQPTTDIPTPTADDPNNPPSSPPSEMEGIPEGVYIFDTMPSLVTQHKYNHHPLDCLIANPSPNSYADSPAKAPEAAPAQSPPPPTTTNNASPPPPQTTTTTTPAPQAAPSGPGFLAGGVASPARGSTPVPGASVAGGLAPSAIISPPAGSSGSPTRVYVNTKVTPVLLEGLKWVARNEPEKPLKWLGEYLMRRSAEVEGS